MKITKCDYCKKTIKGTIYTLAMSDASSILPSNNVRFYICKDCFKELCEKLRNKEENEDGNTES